MEIRNLLWQQSQGGWEDFEKNDRCTRTAVCVCGCWTSRLLRLRKCSATASPSATADLLVCISSETHVTWCRLLYIYIKNMNKIENYMIPILLSQFGILWSSAVPSPLFDLWTYLKLPSAGTFPSAFLPCTLIFRHVVSWLHSWTPVLQPRVSSFCPLNYLFLPSPRTEPVSQPISSFITSWTSPRFPLLSAPPPPLWLPHHSARIFQLIKTGRRRGLGER